MQFGVGLLGNGWKVEQQHERMRADERPARENFAHHAECYAAKIAAETVLSDLPSLPDLTNEGLIQMLGGCALPPRPSEFQMIRDAFEASYMGALKAA
jgi:hypothetical protein